MSQHRQLAAIMFTDIEGYTALMQQDEKNAIQIRFKHREIFKSVTKKYNGELIQYYGDGTLSIFKSSVEAIKCSIEMQRAFQKDPTIPVRIGVHVGDIIRTESDIIGDAVNVASRIESLAVSGSILISDKVNDQLRNQNDIKTKYISAFEFKNVNAVMPVFAIENDGLIVPNTSDLVGKTKERTNKSFKNYRRRVAILLGFLLAVIVVMFFYYDLKTNKSISGKRSIAVLPFEDMNNDDESNMFTDGVTEDIITHLSKIQNLQVTSRASAMHYKNTTKSFSEIANELGVDYILEGSVRKYNDKVRINANLVDAKNNKNLWADNYDNTLVEIFQIQTDVSKDIAEALKITLSVTEQTRLENAPTKNTDAYKAFKQGQRWLHRGGGKVEELKKAENFFKQAVEYDPEFCRAYVGIAETYMEYIFWGRESPKIMLEKASKPALTALAINSNDGGTYGALGAISYYKYEKETAKRYLEKAIEINPSYVGAYNKLAWLYAFEGDLESMESFFNEVLELDPLSSKYIGDMAQAYYYLREFDKGIDLVNRSLEKFPDDNMLIFMKASMNSALGKYEEAIRLFTSRSVASNTNWMLGYTYAVSGQHEEAKRILNYQLEKSKSIYVPAYMIATIYIGLGDNEKALTWLEKDYEAGGQGLFFWGLKMDIKFDPIRNEPRFIALLNKIK